jgi:hypothetical protein
MDETEENALTVSDVSARLVDSQGVEVVASTPATSGANDEWSIDFGVQPMGKYFAHWDSGDFVDAVPVEITGGPMFTVPEARNSDDFLADAQAFPAQEIIDYRVTVEQEFERITGRSFVTRVEDISFAADESGEHIVLLPDAQAIVSATVNGEDVTDLTGWSVSRLGKITHAAACDDEVTMRIRYGFTSPPHDVARVGMIRLRHLLAAESSGIPDRATTWQPEDGGTFRLATPGQGKWKTGIPEVDSTLAGYTLDIVLSVYAGG